VFTRTFLKLRSSMSLKIALIVSVPVALISFTIFYVYQVHEREILFRNTATHLLRMADDMKNPVETFLRSQDYGGIQKLVDQTARGTDVKIVALFNSSGNVTASSENKYREKSLYDMRSDEFNRQDIAAIQKGLNGGYSQYYDPEDEQYCMVSPIFSGGKTDAMLFCADVTSVKTALQEESDLNMGLVSGVALVLGASIYFLFYKLFTKRIQSISSAAVKLAAGDITVKAEAGGIDEIGHLATSFNALADEITDRRANLEEITASRVKELTALFAVVETISQSLDLTKVLPNVLGCVLDNFSASKGVVVLVDRDDKMLRLAGHRGLSEVSLSKIVSDGQGCTGDVILMKKPIRVSGDEEGEGSVPGLEKDEIRSALVVPISVRGEVLGAFGVYSAKKDRFTEKDEALLMAIGSQTGVAVENARLYEQTLDLARMDGLTCMFNRRHLMERLAQEIDRAERYQNSLSLMILDMDKFKSFNDAYGHIKGDELLKAFSSILKDTVRTSDIAGRYGGEEFCVVLPNTSIKGAALIAERIRKAVEGLTIPMAEGQPAAGRTVSVGVTEFSSGDSLEKLLAAADAALYRAKDGGRNRVEISKD
jgi:diguanylate cyclase (GGDEF)-like protein